MLATRNTKQYVDWLRAAVGIAAAAAVLAATAPAHADPHVCGPSCKRVWIPPVIEKQARTIEIPPVFDEVARQVWREPVYEVGRVMVEIPAEVIYKREAHYDGFGRLIGYENVRIVRQPARNVWQTERVLVRPGGWETVVERVCVEPGRTEVVYADVEVRPGHWTTVCNDQGGRAIGGPAETLPRRSVAGAPDHGGGNGYSRPATGFGVGVDWREHSGGGTGFGVGIGWREDQGHGGGNGGSGFGVGIGWRDQSGGGSVIGERVGNGRYGPSPWAESLFGRFDNGRVRMSAEVSRDRR